jgi:Dna[CI] antecedent DciA-like protein
MEEVGKLLPRIFKRQMGRKDPRLVEILGPLWLRVAGSGIAENSNPIAFTGGTLTLETSCLSWAAQLRQMREEIRAEINKYLGCSVVKKIEVTVALDSGRMKPETSRIKFPGSDARKTNGAGANPKIDLTTAQTEGHSKKKFPARGEGRLGSWH